MKSVVALVVALAVACSTSGRNLPDPQGPTPAAPQPSTEIEAPEVFPRTVGDDGMAVFPLDYEPGGVIPQAHHIQGGSSPVGARWSEVAAEVVELAAVFRDADDGDFIHWIAVGIDPALGSFEGQDLPAGIVELANDAGATGWLGLDPPEGVTHRYQLWLYGLDRPFALAETVDAQTAVAWLNENAVSIATMMGTMTGPTGESTTSEGP